MITRELFQQGCLLMRMTGMEILVALIAGRGG
jgi:hypothetical protein